MATAQNQDDDWKARLRAERRREDFRDALTIIDEVAAAIGGVMEPAPAELHALAADLREARQLLENGQPEDQK